MELSALLQLIATFSAAWGAFGAFRTRDNARATQLAEIRSDIKHIIRRLDRIENGNLRRIEHKKREESA